MDPQNQTTEETSHQSMPPQQQTPQQPVPQSQAQSQQPTQIIQQNVAQQQQQQQQQGANVSMPITPNPQTLSQSSPMIPQASPILTASSATNSPVMQTPTSASHQPVSSAGPASNVVTQISGPRGVSGSPMRQPAEYLVLLAPNPRQPGVRGLQYPIQPMNINQPNIIQANPALIRSINAAQLIRQSSPGGVMQPQTSHAQTTTMAGLQGGHVQIPFGVAGPRGQFTLANGQTIVPSMIQRHQLMGPRATILQTPTLIRGISQSGIVHPSGVIPTSQPMGLGIPTSISTGQILHTASAGPAPATATPPSLMTANDALSKGTSFFQTLLTRVNNKSKKTTLQLIQALIDGKKTPKEFASALQDELGSQPQTQLAPFLDLLLPSLRQSLISGAIKLPGIKPPAAVDSSQPTTSSDQTSSSQSTSSPNKVQSNTVAPKKKKTPLPPGQKSAYAIKKEAREAKKREREGLAMSSSQSIKVEPSDEKKETERDKTPKPKPDRPRKQDKFKKQEKQLESLSSALRDDDDVNDVAAMGGVNLAEESQKIMASGAELVGTQIRSCKDEPFLDMESLTARIAHIACEHKFPEPSREVATLISHATQEHLKTIVERLGILAEHRSENLRLNSRYEISCDIKGQMKFLAELDRIEKRRYEEQERELLLRVAKSRSKVEDPEQIRLRQKAKDMQRAEQEEVRQREANETALLAIGPRKKPKSSTVSSIGSFSQASFSKDPKPSMEFRSDSSRRVKRVNMRDLQMLLELDRSNMSRLVKLTAQ